MCDLDIEKIVNTLRKLYKILYGGVSKDLPQNSHQPLILKDKKRGMLYTTAMVIAEAFQALLKEIASSKELFSNGMGPTEVLAKLRNAYKNTDERRVFLDDKTHAAISHMLINPDSGLGAMQQILEQHINDITLDGYMFREVFSSSVSRTLFYSIAFILNCFYDYNFTI